ncbi:hypothetical protein ABW19_dt0200981 [Dactylella cylindrospora]|nr:hypothetical protein ABW19_dt0200981 [Dactylella cylindrospora]
MRSPARYLFLLSSALLNLPISRAQDATRFFIVPSNLDESATGSDRFDSTINWVIGETVQVRWEAEWDTVTLKIWQGVYEGAYYFNDLLRDDPNELSYTWTVAPVLDQAQELNMHFQLLDSTNTDRFFNSRDFRIYNQTDVETETLKTTTQERTVTREVTVTPTQSPQSSPVTPPDVESSSTSAPESNSRSSTSSSTSSTETTPSPTNTSSGNTDSSNSKDGTLKVGLGVGLGLGIPLIALIGAGIYFLGRRHRKKDLLLETPMPAPPPPKVPTAAWYDSNIPVGGIDSANNYIGGNTYNR